MSGVTKGYSVKLEGSDAERIHNLFTMVNKAAYDGGYLEMSDLLEEYSGIIGLDEDFQTKLKDTRLHDIDSNNMALIGICMLNPCWWSGLKEMCEGCSISGCSINKNILTVYFYGVKDCSDLFNYVVTNSESHITGYIVNEDEEEDEYAGIKEDRFEEDFQGEY